MYTKELAVAMQIAELDGMRRRQPFLTVDTLLFALLDNSAVKILLLACWIDLDFLRQELEFFRQGHEVGTSGIFRSFFDLKASLIRPARTLLNIDDRTIPAPSIGYTRLLEGARQIASMNGRELMSSADVLMAICNDKESEMAKLLQSLGATQFAVSEYISHGPWDSDSAPPVPPGFSHVVLLNDPLTPMEIVVDLLETVFEIPSARAINLMLRIHKIGRASCGVFPVNIANEKIDLAMKGARAAGYSLQASRG